MTDSQKPSHQTTHRQLLITQDEAARAATLLLLHRDPDMEHVVKCLRALSDGTIQAIWATASEENQHG